MPDGHEGRPRAFVTGGAGFIGAYVALELQRRGVDVVLADLHPPGGRLGHLLREAEYEFVNLDVTDRDRTAETIRSTRPTAIVHCAALVDPVRLLSAPELAADINVAGTVNVIAAAVKAEVPRLVYLSSVSVLPPPQTDPIGVDHPLLLGEHGPGGGFYGASKIAGEAFCHAAIDGLGLDCSIVRPSAVYGFGMGWGMGVKELLEDVVAHGAHSARSSAEVPRDFTYVRDVAALVAALTCRSGLRQRAFYAATGGELVTLRDVAEVVQQIVPQAQVHLAAEVTSDDEREASYRGRLDITSSKTSADWRPSWSLTTALREYVELERQYLEHSPAPDMEER